MALSIGEKHGLPLRISLIFGPQDAHHTVIVKRRRAGNDMLAWPLFPVPGMIVHEFGHMIGAYDEYPGGGTDPKNPVIDPHSVMAVGGTGRGPAKRHFWHVLQSITRHASCLGLGAPRLVQLKPEGLIPRSGDKDP